MSNTVGNPTNPKQTQQLVSQVRNEATLSTEAALAELSKVQLTPSDQGLKQQVDKNPAAKERLATLLSDKQFATAFLYSPQFRSDITANVQQLANPQTAPEIQKKLMKEASADAIKEDIKNTLSPATAGKTADETEKLIAARTKAGDNLGAQLAAIFAEIKSGNLTATIDGILSTASLFAGSMGKVGGGLKLIGSLFGGERVAYWLSGKPYDSKTQANIQDIASGTQQSNPEENKKAMASAERLLESFRSMG